MRASTAAALALALWLSVSLVLFNYEISHARRGLRSSAVLLASAH